MPENTTEAAAIAAKQEVAEPFFEDVLPNGERKSYATKEEFAKEWQKSRMLQSDYTQKTQAVAAMRKQYDENQKKFDEERKAFLETRKRYDGWDETLKQRPDIQRKLEELIDQPADPRVAFERSRGYTDEVKSAVEQRMEALEKKLAEADSKREIDEAFAGLKAEFPDADESAIMERLSDISDGSVSKLIRQLYYSAKGQLSPAQVEQKITEGLKKKDAARVVPPGPTTPAAPKTFKSTDEAKSQAYKDLGLATGR